MNAFKYTAITIMLPLSNVIATPLELNGVNQNLEDKTFSCVEADGCSSKSTVSVKNSNVSISNSKIEHNASNQISIDSYKSNLILNNTNVTATGESSGLLNAAFGEVTINDGILNYSASPMFGSAIISASYGAKINLNKVNMDFTSASEGGSILANKDSSQININGGKITSAAGTVLRALEGSININGTNIISKDSSGYLADVNNNGTIKIYNSSISHKGNEDAIWLSGSNATFHLESSSIITDSTGTQKNSDSLINSLAGGTSNIVKSSLQTNGDYSRGIESKGITTISDSSIVTKGDFSDAMLIAGGVSNITNTNIITYGDNSDGISIIQSGNNTKKVNINNTTVYTHGQSSAISLKNIELNDKNNEINIKGSTFISDTSPTVTIDNSNGDLNIIGSKIFNNGEGDSFVLSHSTPDTSINLNLSDSIIQGGIISNGINDNISLNNSVLYGEIKNLNNASINNGEWYINNDSNILGNLTANNSTISFVKNNFHKLYIGGGIYGNGNYVLNTDLGKLKGDLITAAGQVYGENTILIKNTGNEPTAEKQKLQIISTGGDDNGNGKFKLINKDGYVNVGTYQYELVKDDNASDKKKTWNLVNTGRLSDSASVAVANSDVVLSQAIWIEQINNLRKRLGNLRNQNDSNGMWIRTYGSKLKLEQNSYNLNSQKVYGVATGYDFKNDSDENNYFIGVRYDYAIADQSFGNNSSGNVYSNDLAGYFTYLFNDGTYIDSILSISRNKNTSNISQTDGDHVSSKYNEYSLGLSTELGKNIKLGSGWFIEPQVEVNYLVVKDTSYSMDNGLNVNLGVGHSLTSRIGGAIGNTIKSNTGQTEIYAEIGVNSQLIASRNIQVNASALNTERRGSSLYTGFGFNHKLSDKRMIYANFDYERGNGIEKPFSYSVGIRQLW